MFFPLKFRNLNVFLISYILQQHGFPLIIFVRDSFPYEEQFWKIFALKPSTGSNKYAY